MDSFINMMVNKVVKKKLCCTNGTTNKYTTIQINQHNNTSTTEQQSSSGEDLSANRKGSHHSKSNNFSEKTFNNYNIQSENNEPTNVKRRSLVIPESETDSNVLKEPEVKQQQDGIIIEKNELFTFMTSDNCNPSQRSESHVSSLFNYNNNIVILDQEVNENKKLLINDIVGNLFWKQEVHIDASGVKNSLRNKRDGVSYFGPVEKANNITINDFLINYKKDNKCLRLFYILFQRNNQKYYFKSINNSKTDKNLFYLKIEKEYKITSKKFFLIQDCLFYVEPNEINNKIMIEMCFAKKSSPVKFEFTSKDSPITIGREKSCKIVLDSNIYSKIHCTLYFDESLKHWTIEDGYREKKSTNGTWMLIDNKIDLNEDAIFKVGNNIFKVSILP